MKYFFPLGLLLFLSASAISMAAEESVSIEQEPRHRLKFANEYVRFFDVELPAGDQTLMHWHRADGVFVSISVADTTAQDLGDTVKKRPARALGETFYLDYGAKPKAHRVTNVDSTTYRVADTEVLKPCANSGSLADGAHQALILDNDRVQVTRLILHPGEESLLHGPCGMLVAVSGGRIEFTDSPQNIEPGGFRWRQSADPLRIANRGDRIFHAVDIRVK
jgi:hypothetical protein